MEFFLRPFLVPFLESGYDGEPTLSSQVRGGLERSIPVQEAEKWIFASLMEVKTMANSEHWNHGNFQL